jgi:ketosteroid isomerase-like protein
MKKLLAVALALIMFVPIASAAAVPDQVFLDIERRISHAVVARDASEMSDIFADDYTSIGVSGQIRSRSEIIQAYSSGGLLISASEGENLKVRQYGDFAIVVGFVRISGKDGAKDITGRYAFTRVYRLESKHWRAVSFQATPVT